MERGILNPFKAIVAEVDVEESTEEDINISDTEDFRLKIINLYKDTLEKNNYKKTIAFVSNTTRAKLFSDTFNEAGIKAGYIHSYMSKVEIERQLEKFERGEIQILFNVDKLTEGFNLPKIGSVLTIDGTRIPKREIQRVGRGLRKSSDGKPTLIIEVVKKSKKSDYALFSRIVGTSEAYSYSSQRDDKDRLEKLEAQLKKVNVDGVRVVIDQAEIIEMGRNVNSYYWRLSEVSREAGWSSDALSVSGTNMRSVLKWAQEFANLKGLEVDEVLYLPEGQNTLSRIHPELAEILVTELSKIHQYLSLSRIAPEYLGYKGDNGSQGYFRQGGREVLLKEIEKMFQSEEKLALPYIVIDFNDAYYCSPEMVEAISYHFNRFENYVPHHEVARELGKNRRFFEAHKDNGWITVLDDLAERVYSSLGYLLPVRYFGNTTQYPPEITDFFKVLYFEYINKSDFAKLFDVTSETGMRLLEQYYSIPGVAEYVTHRVKEIRIESLKEIRVLDNTGNPIDEDLVIKAFQEYEVEYNHTYIDSDKSATSVYSSAAGSVIQELHQIATNDFVIVDDLAEELGVELIQLNQTIDEAIASAEIAPPTPLGWKINLTANRRTVDRIDPSLADYLREVFNS
ncbi:MAG: helicase-related protein [Candidatus Dojkabacteria bacterium]|nr:helicase-related protein [Candidatus Dojkabacteria bacterium]MDQ7021243.1 helicase-related protein [Candidatus Dojkabacteria bacterium]